MVNVRNIFLLPFIGTVYMTNMRNEIAYTIDLTEPITPEIHCTCNVGAFDGMYYECELVPNMKVITNLNDLEDNRRYYKVGNEIHSTMELIKGDNEERCFMSGLIFPREDMKMCYIQYDDNNRGTVFVHRDVAETYFIFDHSLNMYRINPDSYNLDEDTYAWRDSSEFNIDEQLIRPINPTYREECLNSFMNEIEGHEDMLAFIDICQHENTGDDDDDEIYDEDSYDDRDDETHMYSHDYIPSEFYPIDLSNKNNKHHMSIGLEIEVECDKFTRRNNCIKLSGISNNHKLFYLVHDGSLENGIEIVTQPFIVNVVDGAKKIVDKLDVVFNKLDELNTSTSPRCGLHIHIGRNYLKSNGINKLQYMFELFESELIQFSRRKNLRYTVPIRHFSYTENLRDKRNCLISMAICGGIKEDDKYVSLNTSHKQTIEIRLWGGTQKKEEVEAYIEMTLLLCRIANTKTINEINKMEFMDIVKLSNNKSFKKFIKGVM